MSNVGIIGTGKIAGLLDKPRKTAIYSTHAQAIFNSKNLELIAAVDPDRKVLKTFSRIWNVRGLYSTLEEFLSDDLPDVVVISSPNKTHFNLAAQLLKHIHPPKVLFIEKPVVILRDELKEIENLGKDSHCAIIVNHKRRIDPSHRKLSQLISSGALGRMLHGRFTYYGGWLNNGPHLIDLMIMLFGNNFNFDRLKRRDYGRGSDLCIDMVLKYKDFEIDIDSIDEKSYQLFEGEFRFDKGRILYQDFGHKLIIEKAVKNRIGEMELRTDRKLSMRGLVSPLMQSYAAIDAYFKTGDITGFTGITLSDSAIVMNKIFDAYQKGTR
jgi:predicted dehydrogenase